MIMSFNVCENGHQDFSQRPIHLSFEHRPYSDFGLPKISEFTIAYIEIIETGYLLLHRKSSILDTLHRTIYFLVISSSVQTFFCKYKYIHISIVYQFLLMDSEND